MHLSGELDPEQRKRQLDFLRSTLALNPSDQASDILKARRQFISFDGVVEAEVVEDEALYQKMRSELELIRKSFWKENQKGLQQRLKRLSNSPFPEISTSARRLEAVLSQKSEILQLARQPFTNQHFFESFCRVLTSEPKRANQIRETQLRWMRPESNPDYGKAVLAMQTNAAGILSSAPQVFGLEGQWLNEILEFDSEEETDDESSDTILGIALLLLGVFFIGGIGKVGELIFAGVMK